MKKILFTVILVIVNITTNAQNMKNKTSTLRLIYPQWQGGIVSAWMPDLNPDDASRGYYLGAQLLNFLSPSGEHETAQVPISLDVNDRDTENGINSYNVIVKQTKEAINILNKKKPDRIVTLGGECSVSVVPFTYLAEKYKDDVAIVWIDAHPDINLPYDEYTGYHAMALTASLGLGDSQLMNLLPGKVDASKALVVGLRSWEKNGRERQMKLGIKSLSPTEVAANSTKVLDWLKSRGVSKVLVHFDLDVLDPNEIIAGVGVEPNGMKIKEVVRLINDISDNYDLVGLTVAEPMPHNEIKLQNILKQLPLLKESDSSSALRLVYPQWQGGSSNNYLSLPELSKENATIGYYWGSMLLNFLAPDNNQSSVEVPVSLDTENRTIENEIVSLNPILEQTKKAFDILEAKNPKKIVTLGGDCSVSVVPFTYLSAKNEGDIALIWIDAHSDIGLPGDNLDGYDTMALTACLGMGEKSIIDILPSKVDASKTLTVGVRSWSTLGDDIEERQKKLGIRNISADEVATNSEAIIEWLKEAGVSKVFIHFDLDVLDPEEIIAAVSTDPNGMKSKDVIRIINDISSSYDLVGLTIAEPMPRTAIKIKDILRQLPLLND